MLWPPRAKIISIPDFSSFRENIDTAADQLSGSKWYKCISFETTKLLTQNPFFLSIYILQSPPSQKYLRIYISLHHTLPLCIYCADTKRDPSNEQASSLTLIHNFLSKIDPLTSMSLQHFSLQWIVITDIIKILLEPFVVNMYYY